MVSHWCIGQHQHLTLWSSLSPSSAAVVLKWEWHAYTQTTYTYIHRICNRTHTHTPITHSFQGLKCTSILLVKFPHVSLNVDVTTCQHYWYMLVVVWVCVWSSLMEHVCTFVRILIINEWESVWMFSHRGYLAQKKKT